jgi:ferritin
VLGDDHAAIVAFNDAIAAGISSMDDKAYAGFLTGFNDDPFAERWWTVIAASDHADGRVNATALSYFTQSAQPNDGFGDPALLPHLYHYLYDDPSEKLDQWASRSSGQDLAGFFSHLSTSEQNALLNSLTLPDHPDGYATLSESQYSHMVDLWGETLIEFRNRGNADWPQEGSRYPYREIERLLAHGAWRDEPHGDVMYPYLQGVATDPTFLAWYIDELYNSDGQHRSLTNVLRLIDADAAALTGGVIGVHLEAGEDLTEVATQIGVILRTEELLGTHLNLGDFLWTITKSATTEVLKNPLTGPTIGAFEALHAEFERIEQEDQDWQEDLNRRYAHNIAAINLYARANGGLPGFDDWMAEHGRGGPDDPDALINYWRDRRNEADWAKEIDELSDTIKNARNS